MTLAINVHHVLAIGLWNDQRHTDRFWHDEFEVEIIRDLALFRHRVHCLGVHFHLNEIGIDVDDL